MIWNRSLRGGAQIIGCVLGLLGLPAVAATTSPDVVRFGAVVSLTGAQAPLSQYLLRGYRIAVRKINEHGGINVGNRRYYVELVVLDDQSDPTVAAAAAEKMIKGGVRFMLGPFTSELVDAVADVTERRGVPLVQAGGAARSLYSASPRHYFFGIPALSDQYLAGGLDLAVKLFARAGRDPADIKVAVAIRRNALGNEIHDALIEHAKQLGMPVILDLELPDPIQTMVPALRQIEAAKPDLLLVSGYAQGAQVTVRQMAETRTYVPMMVITHCDGAEIERLGAIGDYVVCSSPWDPYAGYADRWFGSSVKFYVEYELAYHESPPYLAAQAAAGTLVMADAIERAGNFDQRAVRDTLAQTDAKTLYGPVQFDGSGRNVGKLMIFTQLQGGRYTVVWPEDIAWSEPVFPAPKWEDR